MTDKSKIVNNINIEAWAAEHPRAVEAQRLKALLRGALGQALDDAGRDPLRRATAILENDPALVDAFGLSTRGNRMLLRRSLPWGGASGDQWTEEHEIAFRHYASRCFDVVIKANIARDACIYVGSQARFDPVADWFSSLAWDGAPRIDTLGTRAFGFDPVECEMLKRTMVGAVRRATSPGCQLDTMLILVGPTGVGKSTFFRDLVVNPLWRYEWDKALNNRDAQLSAANNWMVEFAELKTFSRADSNELKATITARAHTVRKQYGREDRTIPASNWYVGTTNDDRFLIDKTGNRRFWIAHTKTAYMPSRTAIAPDIPMVWAEAEMLAQCGYAHHEDESIAAHQEAVRLEAMIVDDLAEAVRSYVSDRAAVTAMEVAAHLEIELGKTNGFKLNQITTILRHTLGFSKKHGERGNIWVNPKPKMPF